MGSWRVFLHSYRFWQLIFIVTVYLYPFVATPLLGGVEVTAAGFPISVRFVGKIYLVPAAEKGRQRDLLPLELAAERIIYLQVDSFHTPNKEQGELILFSDMQKRLSPIRVINGDMLAALLTDDILRGRQVAINGFLYRTSGLLWIASAHVKE